MLKNERPLSEEFEVGGQVCGETERPLPTEFEVSGDACGAVDAEPVPEL